MSSLDQFLIDVQFVCSPIPSHPKSRYIEIFRSTSSELRRSMKMSGSGNGSVGSGSNSNNGGNNYGGNSGGYNNRSTPYDRNNRGDRGGNQRMGGNNNNNNNNMNRGNIRGVGGNQGGLDISS